MIQRLPQKNLDGKDGIYVLIAWVSGISIVFLAVLGGVSARAGGANIPVGAWRVTFWGALAMAVTAWVGALFGAAV